MTAVSARTVLAALLKGVEVVARAPKDAVLCLRAAAGSKRFYGAEKFTPEQVGQGDAVSWKTTKLFYGGKRRPVRYKEIPRNFWQGGAPRRLLRLLVVAPTPYRKRRSSSLYYRQPAYLLTADLTGHARALRQSYFDPWQIEVNHREENDTLGVGQAHLWNETSVPEQPVLSVAAYSALLFASLQTFGAERRDAYAPLPKWRRHAKRPSCLDLIALLRRELVAYPELTAKFQLQPTHERFTSAAAA